MTNIILKINIINPPDQLHIIMTVNILEEYILYRNKF